MTDEKEAAVKSTEMYVDASTPRHRTIARQASSPQLSAPARGPKLDRRRSSLLSFSSLDDVAQSLNNDVINPVTSRDMAAGDDDQVTHWHATPLAFALLPAVGGLLFQNGSAFMTDVLLLGLAAVFMNWSIRLPWDWYYSAQVQRRVVLPPVESMLDKSVVEPDVIVESSSSEAEGSPAPVTNNKTTQSTKLAEDNELCEREAAAAELRRQEVLALCATFVLPVFGAYLLHVIRGQLSNTSTSIVSDYNLSIFTLAAEIRPCRQLVRLISKRTLHLQRTVMGADRRSDLADLHPSTIEQLTGRISDLEARLAQNTVLPHNVSVAQKTDVTELSTEMRRRYEPRLEALERAVRRYEKRSTTLSMLIDQRIGQLEKRLQDALSLAAVAAQQSNKGLLTRSIEGISTMFMLPFHVALQLTTWVMHLIEELYWQVHMLFFGSRRPPAGKRYASKQQSRSGKLRDSSAARRTVV